MYKTLIRPHRILYSGVGFSVMSCKLDCNIEIGGLTKKTDKNNKDNKKSKRLQLQADIKEIRIKYFTRKENERRSNRK